MKVFVDNSFYNDVKIYLHCETAADYKKVDDQLHTHTEYDTKWADLEREWIDKDYFKFFNREDLIGRSNIIIVLRFCNGSATKEFIKEVVTYLEGPDSYHSGTYYIEYQSYDK